MESRDSGHSCAERMLNVRQTKVRHLKSMEIHPEDLFTIKKQHLMLSGGKKTSQENILNMRQLGKCMFIK